jgi:hypothetical protein
LHQLNGKAAGDSWIGAALLIGGCVVFGRTGEIPVTAGASCDEAATVDWCSGDTLTYCSAHQGYSASCTTYCTSVGYSGAECLPQPGDDVCSCWDTQPAVTAGAACDAATTVDWCAATGDDWTYCAGGQGYVESCSTYFVGLGYSSGSCLRQPGDDACGCVP